jgi:hypothetical protein
MKPQSVSQEGVGASDWIKLDTYKNPFSVSFVADVTGTATYTVQHTLHSVDGGTPTVFDHPDVTGATADADGNYAFPVIAVRVNVTSGSGTVQLTVIQAG